MTEWRISILYDEATIVLTSSINILSYACIQWIDQEYMDLFQLVHRSAKVLIIVENINWEKNYSKATQV